MGGETRREGHGQYVPGVREHLCRDVNSISKTIEIGCREKPTAIWGEVESVTPLFLR